MLGKALGSCAPLAARKRRTLCLGDTSSLEPKTASEGSLLSSPQACHLPFIPWAQERAGIFWCKTRRTINRSE